MKHYLLPLLLGSYLAGGIASEPPPDKKLTMGGFPDVAKLDHFIRGETTEVEVLRELGTPSGRGGALFAPDYRKRFILYYENVEVTDYEYITTTPGSPGYMRFDATQEILGVLILDGHFDGFLWYKNVGQPEARVDQDIPVQQ
jgi:hypothetical protein